jgi:serine phosphatase RsbU (regulator of sigma subunit)
MRSDSAVVETTSAAMLGVLPYPVLREQDHEAPSRRPVVLCTDGITDSPGDRPRPRRPDRLATVLAMSVASPPARIVERTERAVAAYRSGDPTDESAIVALPAPPTGQRPRPASSRLPSGRRLR